VKEDATAAREPFHLRVALLLALLMGLQPLMTDVYLPALPRIAGDFAAPLAAVQMTMSALILAFGVGQIVWGPVADRWGRRPVLVANLLLMLAASLGATFAADLAWLVVWRAAQGATLAAVVVCARATVRDLFEPAQGAPVMALALSGLGLTAIIAPVAGGLLAQWGGWRAAMGFIAAFVAAVAAVVAWRAPETLRERDPRALHLPTFWRNARAVLAHPRFRAWALLVTGTYCGLFVLLSASSYAYIGVLGMSPLQYGLAMASCSVVYVGGTVFCRRWLLATGLARTAQRGAWFTLAGGLGLAACAFAERPPMAAVLLAHWSFSFGHGVHQPCGQTGAVGPFSRTAGLASALAGFITALAAFFVGLWLGSALDSTLRPLGLGVAGAALFTAAVAWTLVRRDGEAPVHEKAAATA
jgi:MFS transporter, DHA1 family, multidrug resistance protein